MKDNEKNQDEKMQYENRSVQANIEEDDQCYEMNNLDECGTESCCEMFCCCC